MKKNRKIIFLIVLIFFLIGLWIIVYSQLTKNSNNSSVLVMVNGQAITNTDLQQELLISNNFFKFNSQKINEAVLKKNILDKMIDDYLINQYAVKQGIKVTDAEIIQRYNTNVAVYNKNNNLKTQGDSAFLAKIQQMYGLDKNEYFANLKSDILREKIQKSMSIPVVQWLSNQRKTVDIQYLSGIK